jgi:hemerythrin
MTSRFEWSPEYEVGHPDLDAQHRQLFAIARQIESMGSQDVDQDIVKDVLGELTHYIHFHFQQEEAILAQVGYPHLAAHHGKHADISAQVGKIIQESSSWAQMELRLHRLMRAWIIDHILEEDMHYKRFVAGLGAKAHKEGLIWRDSYKLGHEVIDSQHRRLFDLVAEILTPEATGPQELTRLKTTIHSLFEYMRSHFGEEEELMEKIGFPLLETHREQHQWLVEQVNQLLRHSHGVAELRTRLGQTMRHWILSHILDEDARLRPYLATRIDQSR